MSHMQQLRDWLTEVQNARDEVKMSIVIIGTTSIFLVIFFVWLTWFNTIGTVAEVPAGGQLANVSGAPEASGFSAWESVKAGGAALFGGVMNGIRGLGGILNTPRKYIIEPTE